MIMNRSRLTNRLALLGAMIVFAFTACGKNAVDEEKTQPEEHEDNIVVLTKAQLQHVKIKTEPATIGNIETTLKAAGRVSENANKTARVSSTLEGRVMKINVDLNDAVKTGDVLGLIQTPELLGKPLELKAPIDGVVTDREAVVGELVGKDNALFTISDPADLWVVAEIKERDIGAVKVGQEATFTVLAYPAEKFRGKVARIAQEVEKESRTLEVRIEVANRDGKLKPGMFADVEIVTDVMQGMLLIPDAALQRDEDKQIVFVSLGDLKFEKRLVQPGLERGGRVQVLGGVKEGEQVVTEGSFILKSEILKGEMGEE